MTLEIIAELHPQHGGQLGMIREMIRQAKINGADVAKFQLYDAVELLKSDAWRYLELSEEDTRRIKRWCDEEEIEFMASVFDHNRLAWCERLGVRRYKIASRTVTADPDLCQAILHTGKETIVSLGSWSGTDKPFGAVGHIKYLYCKAKYPALLDDMGDFPADFAEMGLAGLSDHSLGLDVCLLAVARGATVLEKHFTLDKTRGSTTEKGHVASMTPAELWELRRIGGSLQRARAKLDRVNGWTEAAPRG
jgi:sialic acid synthase SpsE